MSGLCYTVFCWNNYLQQFLIFNSWNYWLHSVSNWPITVAIVDVSLTTQIHSCYFTSTSHTMCQNVSEAAILPIEAIFTILWFRWKRKRDLLIYMYIYIYISQNVRHRNLAPNSKSRVYIFIIDHRPPMVSYLALTRLGLKCGAWYLWQLSKIDFQNLVVKRSMNVSIEEIISQRIFIRVYWFRAMGISSMLMNLSVQICIFSIFVLAE